LPSQFTEPVRIEDVLSLGSNYKIRLRKSDGGLDEIVITEDELREIQIISDETYTPVDSNLLSLLVESYRIKYAYSYDPYFAVSLSGIQTLPTK
jgi:hypothetical protein